MFDRFVIVDWSAANQPTTGRDSIWVCNHGTEPVNLPTRAAARDWLAQFLAVSAAAGERVLVGFDFPFGYPAGFAQRLGLDGDRPWRSLWDEIAGLIEDAPNNRNNRFSVGAELNRRVSNRSFPFWGCPRQFDDEFLGPRHHRGHTEDEPLKERRLIDCWMTGAQPCWKLAYTGSVGSQSLTGIPVVRALRDDPRWADHARVWPFETGLAAPGDAQIVFAEVWPSWWKHQIRRQDNEPNDKAQVRTVAELFAAVARSGELGAWFAGDPTLTDEQRRQVIAEEAWTLGVTAPRQSKTPSLPPRADRAGVRWGISKSTAPLTSPDRRFAATTRSAPGGGEGNPRRGYDYLRDPAAIYRRSFAIIRAETDLARFPVSLRPLALRLAHAAADTAILDNLIWSRGAAGAGRRAMLAGKPVLVDSAMVAAGIIRNRLPAENPVICTVAEAGVTALARDLGTTRSAAAVELWRPFLDGAVVAIGNAPTALFRLLELLAEGAPRPALVLGFPVGFVGAAEAKEALASFGRGLPYIALAGRRGGSALAAAAVNALAGSGPQ